MARKAKVYYRVQDKSGKVYKIERMPWWVYGEQPKVRP